MSSERCLASTWYDIFIHLFEKILNCSKIATTNLSRMVCQNRLEKSSAGDWACIVEFGK